MTASKRIVVNTLAQNIRSILNICLSLASTRIVLEALGQSDYGIYSLVGGVIAMLGFLTNAMVISTQRYLSFLYGKGDLHDVKKVFSNSLIIHFTVGFLLVIILYAIEPLIFKTDFLNIADERLNVAIGVYCLMIVSLFLSFITAPFRALLIARENIVYISIIDVMDGVLKLSLVFTLFYVSYDRLITYAIIMMGIMFFNFLAFAIYSNMKYEESSIILNYKAFDKSIIKGMSNFTGWTLYSTGCIVGRTQGMSVVLNQFFGTVINSAYGIAMQVASSIQFVAQSILNAMSPQIIKAEGAGDRTKMLNLASKASKYTFLLLSLVVIPLVFEMPAILKIWLKDVPDHAVLFCRFILLTSLCDQLTIGLGLANQAIGKIRTYSLVVNTIKILTLPVVWCCLYFGCSLFIVMSCYIGFEIICAAVRLPFLRCTAGLSISQYAKDVFIPILLPLLTILVVCYGMVNLMDDFNLRFVVTLPVAVLCTLPTIWFCSMSQTEHVVAKELLKKRM